MKSVTIITLSLTAFLWVPLCWSADKSLEMIAPTYNDALKQALPESDVVQGKLSALDEKAHEFRMTLEMNRLIECGLLSGMAIISLIIVLSFIKNTQDLEPVNRTDGMLSASGVILIIFATVFLVLVADVNEQLSPSFGILGAIAGYIFGRKSSGAPGAAGRSKD